MNLVFVYGTLQTGQYNNYLLRTSQCLDEGEAEGLTLYSMGGFPAAVRSAENDHTVVGELWQVDDDVLDILDQLEGHPNWYERQLWNVRVETGDLLEAWVYLMPETDVAERPWVGRSWSL